MKIETLIKKLSKYPQGLSVTIDGYEVGYTTHIILKKIKVKPEIEKHRWAGEWREDKNGELEVVNISGRRNR